MSSAEKVESQTLHLGEDNPTPPDEQPEERLEARTVLVIKYRPPPDGKTLVEKSFEIRTPGPFDRRDIAMTTARLAGTTAWTALPSDYRAWAQALATVIVMFRGQDDHEWLVTRCERNPVMLDKIVGEVDAFWATSFPDGFVVGEGEGGQVFAAVEVTQVGPRRPAANPSRPARRAPGVATVR